MSKIIINDVDGCFSENIASDGVSFNPEAVRDIEEYRKFTEENPDNVYVLCTGRGFSQLIGIIERVPAIEWVIYETGSMLRNLSNGKLVDLALGHPSKSVMRKLIEHAHVFTSRKYIPAKSNMLSIDVPQGESNPEYFEMFLRSVPRDLMLKCEAQEINFGYDPYAINVTIPITKAHGVEMFFEALSKETGEDKEELRLRSAYIGDSSSDKEGMRVCHLAAAPNNGDVSNVGVHSYLMEGRVREGRGYISSLPFAKGNLDCLNWIIRS